MLILSWNINMYILKNGGDLISRTENIIRIIKKLNPDMLLLQEASKYFVFELLQLKDYKQHVSVLTHGGYCIILAKPKIKVTKCIKFKLNGCGVIVNDNIKIINCHLTPYFKNHKLRLEVFKQMEDEKTIIMGDTNMDNTQGVDSILKDVGKNMVSKDTWHLSFFENGSEITKRYDRVFTDLKVSNFCVYDNYHGNSDHDPISINLEG